MVHVNTSCVTHTYSHTHYTHIHTVLHTCTTYPYTHTPSTYMHACTHTHPHSYIRASPPPPPPPPPHTTQTGSGKTYSMGTGFGMGMSPEQQGVIPRAVSQLFSTIQQLREDSIARGDPPPQFEITAQFLEVSFKKLRVSENLRLRFRNGFLEILKILRFTFLEVF